MRLTLTKPASPSAGGARKGNNSPSDEDSFSGIDSGDERKTGRRRRR